jgi:high-affinity nickel-transport protein
MDWKIAFAIGSCALLGLRHGFDYDHLAAISDITAVQQSRPQGVRLGVIYALGHAFTVVTLGVLVIMLHISLPARLDAWAERLIGVTLIVLGILVVANLARQASPSSHGHSHQAMQSRWALLINAIRQAFWRVRKLFRPDTPQPAPFAWSYNSGSVFGIGVLHGLGAETPTQLMLFLLAASLGGTTLGLLGLLAFAVGLVAMNTVMTAALSGLFGVGMHRPQFYRIVAVVGALYSLAIGFIFLFGASEKLPPISG